MSESGRDVEAVRSAAARVRRAEPNTLPHSSPRNHALDFRLQDILPRRGDNTLSVTLEGRPEGLEGSVRLEEIEIHIDYSPYPSAM